MKVEVDLKTGAVRVEYEEQNTERQMAEAIATVIAIYQTILDTGDTGLTALFKKAITEDIEMLREGTMEKGKGKTCIS